MSEGPGEPASRVLERRAALLAQPLRNPGRLAPDSVHVLEFTVAGQACALELASLKQVRPLKELAPLPLAARHVLGIANVRGHILPVIDLAGLLGLKAPAAPAGLMLLFGGETVEFGFVVEEIGAISTVCWTDIARRSDGMKDFQPAIARGTTAAGRLVLDGQALLAFGKNAWGAASPETNN